MHSYDDGKPGVKHLVYASSSSIYGLNKEVPYRTEDKTDKPVSLYAATKKSKDIALDISIRVRDRITHTGLCRQIHNNFKKKFPEGVVEKGTISYMNQIEEAFKDANICFIFTEWKEIKKVEPEAIKQLMRTPLVYDGRNIFEIVHCYRIVCNDVCTIL